MPPISTGGLLALLVALLPLSAAQFNTECGVGEVPLKMKIGGTDKLTKCSDLFDDVVRTSSVCQFSSFFQSRRILSNCMFFPCILT